MRRYLRTLLRFWAAAVGAEMEYRTNFVMAAVTSASMLAGSLFGLSLFYQNGYAMGDWSWPQVLIVMGLYTLLDGVQVTLLAPNRQRITEYVREGTLDFVLLKPIDSQFVVSVREVSLWGLPNVVLGLVLVVYAGSHPELQLGWPDYARGLVPIALGLVVLYGIGFVLGTFTIWFVKLWNVTIAMQSLLEAGRYPIRAYVPRYQTFFTYIVPVVFLTTVPAEAMIGTLTRGRMLAAVALAIGLFYGSRLFWRFALRYYTSASS